jgi:hypothetical protein
MSKSPICGPVTAAIHGRPAISLQTFWLEELVPEAGRVAKGQPFDLAWAYVMPAAEATVEAFTSSQ